MCAGFILSFYLVLGISVTQTLVVYKCNCVDALRTKQCFIMPGKKDVNDGHGV